MIRIEKAMSNLAEAARTGLICLNTYIVVMTDLNRLHRLHNGIKKLRYNKRHGNS